MILSLECIQRYGILHVLGRLMIVVFVIIAKMIDFVLY